MSLAPQIQLFSNLENHLSRITSTQEKIRFLIQRPEAKAFLATTPPLQKFLQTASPEAQQALLSVVALNQGPIVFQGLKTFQDPTAALNDLAKALLPVEDSYSSLGGIIGYHLKVLQLIQENTEPQEHPQQEYAFIKPEGLDISQATPKVHTYIRRGIEALPWMADIYPVGGAGDRLGLVDENTGIPLPAAKLNFCGRSLLEGLFRDLHAREYLYYQLMGKRILTPVALMTSHEKNNHAHIQELCERSRWFGRPRDSIRFFIQPLVPTITVEGNWCLSGPLQLKMKPGGHGVLWKLALEAGILDGFEADHKSKMLVRQINNPIAGIDYGLLALIGYGCAENKAFGFASCPRVLHAHEGMNVVLSKHDAQGYHYTLTNLEYTDFAKRGIQDIPEKPGSPYSALPSNTNILFADIKTIKAKAQQFPIPGLLINLKTKLPYTDPEGNTKQLPAGRLEATMQNVADYIVDTFSQPLRPSEFTKLSSFLTYNLRRKTLSVTKILYEKGKSLLGTPEGCLYEMLENYADLFTNHCGFELPPLGSEDHYLEKGPPFFILLHPAIGPLFSVISQKIQGGKLAPQAELQLEIAEAHIQQLQLEGSLRVISQTPINKQDAPEMPPSDLGNGKCRLKNVCIKNRGIDHSSPQNFWSNHIIRHEEVYIELASDAEFIAENITFSGPHKILVPAGQRMIAYEEQGVVKFKTEAISRHSPLWRYAFDTDHRIRLSPYA